MGVLLVAGVVLLGVYTHAHISHSGNTASTTSENVSSKGSLMAHTDLAIYTNGQYGFSLFYPATSTVQTSFDSTYHLPATWRVDALANATGTPVVEIIGYETKSDTSFPRYFEAEVRVGVSADPKEVAACDEASDGETALPSAAFGGASWHVFSLQLAGMMQYAQGISYRSIHDGSCYALEQVESGSSYVNDATSTADISQSVLDAQYKALSTVIKSFSFARP